MSADDVLAAADRIPYGRWTSYGELSTVVYGHPRAAKAVGAVMRTRGSATCAHRVLREGGEVAPGWGAGGAGPRECVRRLRTEGSWDEARQRARADRFVGAEMLREPEG